MMASLRLEFHILLAGLERATHLNGRKGVIRGTTSDRFIACLDDDGTRISVKAGNVEYIRSEIYKRRAP